MSKSPYAKTKIDANGRVCTHCLIYKPWGEFHKDKTRTRGYCSQCKDCACKSRRINRLQMIDPRTITKKNDINLSELLVIRKVKSNQFTFAQAKFLFEGVIAEYKKGNQSITALKIAKKYGSGKKTSSCIHLLTELKKAAKAGLGLAEYWNKGRPYSISYKKKEVLYPAKKQKS